MDRYKTFWSDEEIVKAIAKYGVDKLQPANLNTFFSNLPRPERERLIREAEKSK